MGLLISAPLNSFRVLQDEPAPGGVTSSARGRQGLQGSAAGYLSAAGSAHLALDCHVDQSGGAQAKRLLERRTDLVRMLDAATMHAH